MPEQYRVFTRAEFYQYIAETGQVPKLFNSMDEGWVCKGFRAISSGLFPPGEDVWMWPDGMCLVTKAMFAEMKAALEALGG